MAHPRKVIRQAVRDRLAQTVAPGVYRTAAQNRVYASRLAPVSEEELREDGPAILIYARMEKSHAEKDYGIQGDATTVERELLLVTEAMLLGGDTVDDRLDDIAEEMEAAFNDFVIPGCESARIRLIESDIDLVTENVKRPIGCIGLVWQINYRTEWRARSNIDNFDQSMADFLAGR
jgi:hypothetical protein